MKNKIKFLLFAMKQCFYDNDLYCLTNAFHTLKKCKQKHLKLIMLNNKNDDAFYDDIALCINKNNECIYIVDDFCELHCY